MSLFYAVLRLKSLRVFSAIVSPIAMAGNALMHSRFKGMTCSMPVNPSKAENQVRPETVSSVYSHQQLWVVQVGDFNPQTRFAVSISISSATH